MPKANLRAQVASAEDGEKCNLFGTSNIGFAAYLKASGRLTFERVEVHAKFSDFYFRDPLGEGPALFREFSEDNPQVSATGILEARGELLVLIQRGRL
jgi:hypothetical protein